MPIETQEEFEAWLKEQPREVCAAIAYRAAMRVLPLTTDLQTSEDAPPLALWALRCNLTSAVAAKLPNANTQSAANDSLYFGDSTGNTDSAVGASLAAARAVEASTDVGTAVSAAFDTFQLASAAVVLATDSRTHAVARAFDKAVFSDTEFGLEQLMQGGIFMPAELSFLIDLATGPQNALSVTDGPWSFWAKWYRSAMAGTPLPWDLQEQIALIPDAIWDAGPDAVAEEIEKLQLQHRTSVAPRLVRDEQAEVFRVEDDPTLPVDMAQFAADRAGQALNATLQSVSDNIFNASSYEAVVIQNTLDGPKTCSLVATGLYDACLSLNANIGDRYPEEIALINLKNALAGLVDEICEHDAEARARCARLAGYSGPPVVEVVAAEELLLIPDLTAPEVDAEARAIIESDVERILSEQATMPRWRQLRFVNWMTTISIYWDRTKKGFKEAEALAKMVSKLQAAWQRFGSNGE